MTVYRNHKMIVLGAHHVPSPLVFKSDTLESAISGLVNHMNQQIPFKLNFVPHRFHRDNLDNTKQNNANSIS